MDTYKEYKDLLSKTYDKAIDCLLQKYGPAQDDYFREKSYQRFMAGETKNITKGKFSRTDEGLYCHHIDEKKYLNISSQSIVKMNKISFDYQRKDRLVYCDLIEHTILHVLITKETSFKFGYPGYAVYLKPIIEEWYLDKMIPKREWMKKCYDKSFLTPEQTVNILMNMQKTIGKGYYNTPFDYYEAKQKKREELKELKKARKRAMEKEDIEQAKKNKEREKQIQKKRIEKFYYTYPRFNSMGIRFDTPRRKVIAMLYDYKYKDTYKSKKELELAIKPIIKDELLQELYLVISNVEDDKR